MKYTRLELHSALAKHTLKNIVIFFVLIPLIAIGIGKLVTSTVIVPYVSKTIQPVQYTYNNDSSINKIDYYILQAGVFMNIENAQVLQRGINKTNRNSFIVNDTGSFRVIVDISEDKKSILIIEEALKNLGYNCIINNFSFNSGSRDTELFEGIGIIFDIIKNEQNLIKDNENQKEAVLKQINDQKNKIEAIYDKKKAEKNGITSSDNFLENYSLIIKGTNEFIQNIENKKNNEAKGSMVSQLYSFKKIYDDYTKSK